jgi:hypothetical protein
MYMGTVRVGIRRKGQEARKGYGGVKRMEKYYKDSYKDSIKKPSKHCLNNGGTRDSRVAQMVECTCLVSMRCSVQTLVPKGKTDG